MDKINKVSGEQGSVIGAGVAYRAGGSRDGYVADVVEAWAVFERELNASLVGMMDLSEKRAMGAMRMAVCVLRESDQGAVIGDQAGDDEAVGGFNRFEAERRGVVPEPLPPLMELDAETGGVRVLEWSCVNCGNLVGDLPNAALDGSSCLNGWGHKWVEAQKVGGVK